MIVVQIAWLLLSLAFLGLVARDRIAEPAGRKQRHGRSWETHPFEDANTYVNHRERARVRRLEEGASA